MRYMRLINSSVFHYGLFKDDAKVIIFYNCRSSAEQVLEKAKRVISALKAAKEAQEEAEQAINTAHEDITAAKKDLKQVFIY